MHKQWQKMDKVTSKHSAYEIFILSTLGIIE